MNNIKFIRCIYELIVTQWDVNESNYMPNRDFGCELIVTQWDVNYSNGQNQELSMTELIVTQWDVNEHMEGDNPESEEGINSYIVGCKCRNLHFQCVLIQN